MGNFEIDQAGCVDEALKKLSSEHYDIVVSDYEMPQKDGLQFLKELRESKNEIPFILFIGKGREDVAIQALNLGADGYHHKQGSPETVYGELSHLMHLLVEKTRSKTQTARDSVALQTVEDAILTSDQTQTIVSWNKAAEEVFGWLEKEAIGRNITDIFVPMQLDVTLQNVIQTLQEKGRFSGEVQYKNKKEQLRHGELTIINQTSKNGEFLGSTIVCHDTTERKKAERALEDSEEKYRKLFEESMDAIFVADTATGIIVDCNPAASKLVGRQKSELVGQHQSIITPQEQMDGRFARVFKEHLKDQTSTLETKIIRKTGEIRYVAVKDSVFVLNGKKLMQGTLRDITERKKEEELLKESEEKYKNLFENAPDVIVTVDLTGKITSENKAITHYGFKENEVVGESIFKLVPIEYNQKMLKDLKNLAAGHPAQGETEILTPKGKRNAEYSSNPIWLNGKVVGYQTVLRDVTERKIAEDALRKSEEEYSSLFNNMMDGFAYCKMVFDETEKPVDFIYLQINDAFEKITGLKKQSVIGKKVTEAIPGIREANPELFEIYGKVANTGQKEKFEIFFKPLSLWLSVSAYCPKKDYFAAMFEDITERKKTEDSLKEREENFRNLAEESPNMIFINQKGKVVYANKKCEDTIGYTEEEFYSPTFNFLSIIAPESVEKLKSSFAMHLRGEEVPAYEYSLISKDGQRIEAIINTKLTEYNGEKAILGIVTDITEREKAKRELQESEERFRSLFEQAPLPVAITALNGTIFDANVSLQTLLGCSLEELKKTSAIHLYENPQDRETLFEILEQNGVVSDFSTRLKRKDGTCVDVVMNVSKFQIGQESFLRTAFQDVTERKKAEETLDEVMNQLVLVNEKLGVVGSLTRHDVRNKLSAITGYAYLLKKRHPDQTDIVDGLSKMEQAVKDSMQIFDFAKMYEQLGVEELSLVSLENAINEAVALFSGLNIKVVNDCHGLTVLADSFVRQLLYNFVDNTRKYGKKTTTIRIYYQSTNSNELRLIYEDDGVGISAENKSKLFSEGFSTGGSTGFGLFLTKKMIDVYGWEIEENGEPGTGAKFTITIPKLNKNGKENYQIIS
jgi:PAS domain S-box-containing protein